MRRDEGSGWRNALIVLAVVGLAGWAWLTVRGQRELDHPSTGERIDGAASRIPLLVEAAIVAALGWRSAVSDSRRRGAVLVIPGVVAVAGLAALMTPRTDDTADEEPIAVPDVPSGFDDNVLFPPNPTRSRSRRVSSGPCTTATGFRCSVGTRPERRGIGTTDQGPTRSCCERGTAADTGRSATR